jgi:hypothetical protein
MVLLISHNNIDVIRTPQTMVHDGKKTVAVRREVDPHDFGRLVGHDVEKAGVLVREAVVVLPPDGGGKEDVEGGDGDAPGDFVAFLDPFAVLVHHAVNDVDERLVAVK